MRDPRDWEVLLIAGASGVGKTAISYPLAHEAGVGITEVDDFQVVLERMTSPQDYPELHLWRRDPEAFLAMDEAAQLQHMVSYAGTVSRALELVVANHLRSGPALVLEGDFILPSLGTLDRYDGVPAGGRVRTVVLVEPEEAQIARNYHAREGRAQPDRARLSWLYSEWLRREAVRLGVPVLSARPWDTVRDRARALLTRPGAPSVTGP